MPDSLKSYKDYVRTRLKNLNPVFAKAAIGDFSQNVELPDKDDDFISLYAGIQIMLEVIRDQIEELTRKKDEAEMLEKVKSEFISTAAHQLRTPLSHIRWNLEIMLKDKKYEKNPQLLSNIQAIYRNNLQMISLVNRLLSIARIEQGKIISKPKKIDLIGQIRQIAAEFKPELIKKRLKFNLYYSRNLPPVYLDPDRLREVITNLLTNSAKYTNSHKGKISLTCSLEGNEILVKVRDNGIGIPKDDQKRIFNKFFRAKNATISETDGSGLGLFIAKSFVTEWGGKLGFKSPVSRDEKGTLFFFTIPL